MWPVWPVTVLPRQYKTSRVIDTVKNSNESVRRLRCNCEFSIPVAREVGCRRVPAHKRCGNCKQASAQRQRRKQTRMLKLKSLRSRNHQSSNSTWDPPPSRHREARKCPTPARSCARRTPWAPSCTPWCTPAHTEWNQPQGIQHSAFCRPPCAWMHTAKKARAWGGLGFD